MMSYLWILLLGSLLASHATAQEADDAAPEPTELPTVEAIDADPAPTGIPADDDGLEQGEAEADVTGQEQVDGDAEPGPTPGDTEAGDPAEAVEPTPPNEETAEAGDPAVAVEPTPSTDENAEGDTPEGDAVVTTKEEDTDAATPPGPVDPVLPEVSVTPADKDADAVTSPVDLETEGSTTIAQVVEDGVTEEPTKIVEVEIPANTDAPLAEDDNGDKTIPEADDSVDSNEDIPTIGSPVEPPIQEDTAISDVGFNLEDALQPDGPKETPDSQNPPRSRSGDPGTLDKSEGAKAQAQEGKSGSLAGILSGIIVSAVGAVSGYFAYQKKKLCFKNRQDADPEAARKADAAEAQSDPQALNTLLNSS